MVDYGKVRAAEAPENIVIDECSVWVSDNIRAVQVPGEEGQEPRTEYEFDLKQYEKDEYIHNMDAQLTDAQMALCDLYEMIGGI